MITPRVPSVASGRADWNDLEHLDSDRDVHVAEGVHATVQLWESPEHQVVVAFYCGHAFTVEDAAGLGAYMSEHVPPGSHVFVSGLGYADGFGEALDSAVSFEIILTLLEQPPVHPEVAAVPTPDPAPAVTAPVTVTERDFDFLTGTSFEFDFEHWREVLETYDPAKPAPDAEVDSHWTMAYVMDREGSSYADVMLAGAFLTGNGWPYELASASSEEGSSEWWLLTDFKTVSWRRRDAQVEVEKRLKQEAAEESGDELMQAFLMQSAAERRTDEPHE
ncbi:hypothetical protein [Streptomyces sp. NPDC001089]